ncbi:hypothetical protein V8G69_02520 [Gaetbulibacter sp. M235]|uniref:hypothetical protein n=1 Tax=Gaetbulibacter sp. M235 TaxID=3126510 RepID=UPI00374F1F60
MKSNGFKFLIALLALFIFTNCSRVFYVSNKGKSSTAPGQIKKSTGSQSAKPYAPGQNKNK